jgi:hypothetical protein
VPCHDEGAADDECEASERPARTPAYVHSKGRELITSEAVAGVRT